MSAAAAAGAPPRESLAQAKQGVQQLVDGLSAAMTILQERGRTQALALEAGGGLGGGFGGSSRQTGGVSLVGNSRDSHSLSH